MFIGLTGGIGAGKSLVSRRLSQLGAKIIDADAIAKDIVAPGQAAYQDIVEVFGKSVLNDNGEINRSALGKLVFSDVKLLNRLERITHPRIFEMIENLYRQYSQVDSKTVVVLDAPLLIEGGLYRQVDQVWVVVADMEQRIKRVVDRDNTTRELVEQRIQAQLSDEERLKHADVVIDNNGMPSDTEALVDKLWKKINPQMA